MSNFEETLPFRPIDGGRGRSRTHQTPIRHLNGFEGRASHRRRFSSNEYLSQLSKKVNIPISRA